MQFKEVYRKKRYRVKEVFGSEKNRFYRAYVENVHRESMKNLFSGDNLEYDFQMTAE